MINPFVIKKYASLMTSGMLTTILFYIGSIYYGLIIGIGFFLIGLICSMIIGSILLKNPFQVMLEGKGILAIDLTSTGIMKPFICQVQSPYISGKLDGKMKHDVFDRATVMQMAVPKINGTPAVPNKKGGVTIDLDQDEYNSARFALFHYPVIIYNSQIDSVITKDMLSEAEKSVFAEHGILYLNRKIEELTSAVRDFGRYVVENLKPSGTLFQNKWFWIILVVFGLIMLLLFGKPVVETLSSSFGGATNVMANSAVSPR